MNDKTTPVSQAKVRVMILFGGRSGEHPISCATAAGVLRAIDRDKYEVVPVGITPDGHWVPVADDPGALEITQGHLPQVTASSSELILPISSIRSDLQVRTGEVIDSLGTVDVVFPLLHGPYGEDGTLQGLLEMLDLPYVGAGVLASALSMDKHYMKVAFSAHALPVGPYVVVEPAQWVLDQAACEDAVASLGLPVFVKPARAGSSLGVTKVDREEDLVAAIEIARQHDPKVIVEAAINGREIECAVLDGRGFNPPRTSLPGEIAVSGDAHAFYDFEAKYLDSANVELSCPADLPDDVRDEIRTLAAKAFQAVGCEGLARVDFFYTDRGRVVINEINTLPGFTPFSMYPQMWERTGIGYADLIDELIQLALARPKGLR